MAEVAPVAVSSESPVSTKKTAKPKKEKKVAAGKPRSKANHPPTALMVNNAIQSLKERGGSSLQAIKKYIAATYKIDAEKFSPYIKKYIKSSVTSGGLVQTKGKGASGSFKLAATAVTKGAAKKAKKPVAEKPKVVKPAVAKKSPVTKKAAKPKKVAVKKPAAKVAKPKTPSKAKTTAKVPTKKPKSPKPKTVKPKAVKSAKKASPKKK